MVGHWNRLPRAVGTTPSWHSSVCLDNTLRNIVRILSSPVWSQELDLIILWVPSNLEYAMILWSFTLFHLSKKIVFLVGITYLKRKTIWCFREYPSDVYQKGWADVYQKSWADPYVVENYYLFLSGRILWRWLKILPAPLSLHFFHCCHLKESSAEQFPWELSHPFKAK